MDCLGAWYWLLCLIFIENLVPGVKKVFRGSLEVFLAHFVKSVRFHCSSGSTLVSRVDPRTAVGRPRSLSRITVGRPRFLRVDPDDPEKFFFVSRSAQGSWVDPKWSVLGFLSF